MFRVIAWEFILEVVLNFINIYRFTWRCIQVRQLITLLKKTHFYLLRFPKLNMLDLPQTKVVRGKLYFMINHLTNRQVEKNLYIHKEIWTWMIQNFGWEHSFIYFAVLVGSSHSYCQLFWWWSWLHRVWSELKPQFSAFFIMKTKKGCKHSQPFYQIAPQVVSWELPKHIRMAAGYG